MLTNIALNVRSIGMKYITYIIFSDHGSDDGEGLPHPKEILFRPENLDFTWKPQVGAGFMNCGNTCFLNATLQCLVHCPPLMNFMMSGQHSSCCKLQQFRESLPKCLTVDFGHTIHIHLDMYKSVYCIVAAE